jgi:hypothetical protein
MHGAAERFACQVSVAADLSVYVEKGIGLIIPGYTPDTQRVDVLSAAKHDVP